MDYNAVKAAAAALAAEQIEKAAGSHYADVDKQFSKLESIGKGPIKQNIIDDLAKSADYSSLVYNLEKLCNNLDKDTEFLILSHEYLLTNLSKSAEEKDPEQPDVVAFISKNDVTQTLWVVARGTQTVTDAITDLMWLVDITEIGGLPLPKSPIERAEKSLNLLIPFIEKTSPKRIIFTGHSLGGAISGSMFYYYNYMSLKQSNPIESFLYTISSPQLLTKIPDFLLSEDGNSKIGMLDLSGRVHNIIQRADIIPRSVGPNKLPKFLTELQVIGPKIVEFEKQLKLKAKIGREAFVCFGNYYALNPKHLNRQNMELKHVNGEKLLNVFSSDLATLALAAYLDHSSDTTFNSLIDVCPEYKRLFIWEPERRIIGESYPFPEEYRKRKKESRYKDSNADEGKSMINDSYVINGCFCCLEVLYTKFPQCLGCYGNQTCCCIAYEYKYCKYYENEPGKWCLCQQAKCDCIVPRSCCKAINQCCCCDNRFAFPPYLDPDLPSIFSICGLTLWVNGRTEVKFGATVGELLETNDVKQDIAVANKVVEEDDDDAPRQSINLLKSV